MKTCVLGLLPGLVLVVACWTLGQVQWSGGALEDGVAFREEVVWRRYQVAGAFLLYVVVCLTAWLAVLDVAADAWIGSRHGASGLSGNDPRVRASDAHPRTGGERTQCMDRPFRRPSMGTALAMALVTGVILCLGDVVFHRERLGMGASELALGGEDMSTALAWYRAAASVIFGLTVAMLVGVGVLVGPGSLCDGVVKEGDSRVGYWKLARETQERIDRWDGFLLHGVGFAVAGLMFMDSWMKWVLVRLSGDEATVGMYEQAVMGLLGYHAAVLVVLLGIVFVPTRVGLRSVLRGLESSRNGINDSNKGRDVPTRVVALIMTPAIVQVAAGILWIVWRL